LLAARATCADASTPNAVIEAATAAERPAVTNATLAREEDGNATTPGRQDRKRQASGSGFPTIRTWPHGVVALTGADVTG
jgi:hypothetical protein